jgi:hypothetical protein
MLLTWFRTVMGEMNRARPISALDSPSARSVSTSPSRADSPGHRGGIPRPRFREERQQARGQARTEDGVSLPDPPDGAHHLLWGGALHQVAAGAGAQCGKNALVVLGHGQDQHPGPGPPVGEPPGGGEATDVRHRQVHDDDVGVELLGQPQGLRAGGRLADDDEIRLPAEDEAQALPEHRVVVGDQDPERCAHHATSGSTADAGSRAVTVVPRPSTE